MSGKKSILLAIAAFMIGSVAVANADPKVPTTVEDHLALAKQYRDKAEAAKKEAAEHREMAEKAKRASLNAHKEQGQGDPSVQKMEKHCAAIAARASALAAAEEKAADYHELRAKELQGK
jgi:hypothetical protein